jgi:hypothetical protein
MSPADATIIAAERELDFLAIDAAQPTTKPGSRDKKAA